MDHPTGDPLVLVIEDDTQSRRFLASALAARRMRCVHAGTAAHLRSVFRHDHDIVLVDAGPVDAEHLDLVQRVRARTAAPLIALLTQPGDRARAVLEAGANDYVAHPFTMEDVIARIQVWLKHGSDVRLSRPRSLAPVHLRIDRERACVFVDGQEVHVTPIEFRLLDLLVRAGASGVREGHLCATLWGRDGSRSVQYLRAHIRQLKNKIEADPAHPRYLVVEASRPGRTYRLRLS